MFIPDVRVSLVYFKWFPHFFLAPVFLSLSLCLFLILIEKKIVNY